MASDSSVSGDFSLWALLAGAEAFEDSGQTELAAEMYAAACSETPHPAALAAYAGFLRKFERFGAAIRKLTDLLDYAHETGDIETRSWSCEQIAGIYRDLGNNELAWKFQQLALQHKSHCDHVDLTHLAADALSKGNAAAAEGLAEHALQLSSEYGTLDDVAADCGHMGLVAGLQGNPREAILRIWDAYRLHQESRNHFGMGCDLMNLSEFFGSIGRVRAERRCLERAILRFEEAQAFESLGRARRCLRSLLLRERAKEISLCN